MVRMRNLEKSAFYLPYFIYGIISLLLIFTPVRADGGKIAPVQTEIQAKVYQWGMLSFGKLPKSFLQHRNRDVYLEVSFRSNRVFDARRLRLSLNGYRSCFTSSQLVKWAKWHQVNGKHVLRIPIGRLKFGNKKHFLRHLETIQGFGGRPYLWVSGGDWVTAGKLVFAPNPKKPVPPRVEIQTVEPKEYLIRQNSIRFEFDSPDIAERFECRINGQGWEACESPKVYSGLSNRNYKFRVRAFDEDDRHGRNAVHQFQVAVPKAAVKITRVRPKELTKEPSGVNQTDKDFIKLWFKKKGKDKNFVRTYCRLDGGSFQWCDSPIAYSNLSKGEHEIEIRRTHWLYGKWWAKWMFRFKWFRRYVPVYTEPVVYAWKIGGEAPTVSWTETPAELTQSSEVTFSFQSNVDAQFECSVDQETFQSCVSPLVVNTQEGSHEIQVRAKAGELVSEAISYRWSVDQTSPVLSWVSLNPSVDLTRQQTLQAVFETSELGTLTCLLDGEALEPCASPIDLVNLSEGVHRLSVSAEDLAGNQSENLEHVWEIDLTVPDVAISLVEPVSLPTHENYAVFEFEASENAQLFCALDGGSQVPCLSPYSLDALGEGHHVLAVTPVDAAGNEGLTSTFEWEVDQTAPVLTLVETFPAEFPTDSGDIEVRFEVSELGASVSCELDLGGQIPCQSPFVSNGLAEGGHQVVIRAVDGAGNQADALRLDWEIHKNAVATLTHISPSSSLTQQDFRTFQFDGVNVTSFECAQDGGPWSVCESPVTIEQLSDGAHQFQVRGLNLYGEAGAEASHQWTVDRTAPHVSLQIIAPLVSPTSETHLSVSFSADETATFRCQLDTDAEKDCVSPFEVTGLADGLHLFKVTASDSLGNTSEAATFEWSIDTVPGAVSLSNIVPSEAITNSSGLSLSLSAENADHFVCVLDGASYTPCEAELTLSGLSEGSHTLSVSAANASGNQGPSTEYTWHVDTSGPSVTIQSLEAAWNVNELGKLTASFSAAEPSVSFLCSVDGGAEQACTSPFVLTGLSDGAHQFAVVGEDALGNRGEVQSQSFTVTSTPLTIASAAVQGITQNTATLVWSTNLPANSQVVYGQGTSLDSSSALQSASVTAHSVGLTGLQRFTTYSAQAVSIDQAGREIRSQVFTFRTLR